MFQINKSTVNHEIPIVNNILLQPVLRGLVVGPSGSGKTTFILNLILKWNHSPNVWYVGQNIQQKDLVVMHDMSREGMSRSAVVEKIFNDKELETQEEEESFNFFLNKSFLKIFDQFQSGDLVILDDLSEKDKKSPEYFEFLQHSRPNQISICIVTQNYFTEDRTHIRHNINFVVLFKSNSQDFSRFLKNYNYNLNVLDQVSKRAWQDKFGYVVFRHPSDIATISSGTRTNFGQVSIFLNEMILSEGRDWVSGTVEDISVEGLTKLEQHLHKMLDMKVGTNLKDIKKYVKRRAPIKRSIMQSQQQKIPLEKPPPYKQPNVVKEKPEGPFSRNFKQTYENEDFKEPGFMDKIFNRPMPLKDESETLDVRKTLDGEVYIKPKAAKEGTLPTRTMTNELKNVTGWDVDVEWSNVSDENEKLDRTKFLQHWYRFLQNSKIKMDIVDWEDKYNEFFDEFQESGSDHEIFKMISEKFMNLVKQNSTGTTITQIDHEKFNKIFEGKSLPVMLYNVTKRIFINFFNLPLRTVGRIFVQLKNFFTENNIKRMNVLYLGAKFVAHMAAFTKMKMPNWEIIVALPKFIWYFINTYAINFTALVSPDVAFGASMVKFFYDQDFQYLQSIPLPIDLFKSVIGPDFDYVFSQIDMANIANISDINEVAAEFRSTSFLQDFMWTSYLCAGFVGFHLKGFIWGGGIGSCDYLLNLEEVKTKELFIPKTVVEIGQFHQILRYKSRGNFKNGSFAAQFFLKKLKPTTGQQLITMAHDLGFNLKITSRDKIDSDDDFLIINTGDSKSSGFHWVALYQKRYYFDPYGCQPLKEVFGEIEYNSTKIQYPNTNVCGQLCIFFFLCIPHVSFFEFSNSFLF